MPKKGDIEARLAALEKRVAALEDTGELDSEVSFRPSQTIAKPSKQSTNADIPSNAIYWTLYIVGIILLFIDDELAVVGILIIAGTFLYQAHQNNKSSKPSVNKHPRPSPVEKTPKIATVSKQPAKQISQPKPKPVIKPKPTVTRPSDSNIGTVWLTRIGIISLVLGMAFFLKYAFDRNWIPPEGRVAIGILIGGVLCFLGHTAYKKHGLFGQALLGGGFVIMYASFYAAYEFYAIASLPLTIMLLSVVALMTLATSLKKKSSVIAGLAFLLGYLTAFLTGESTWSLLFYTLILTLASVYIVLKTGWQLIGLGAMVGTYLLHAMWLNVHPHEHFVHLCALGTYLGLFSVMIFQSEKFTINNSQSTRQLILSVMLLVTLIFTLGVQTSSVWYVIFYAIISSLFGSVFAKKGWGSLQLGIITMTYFFFGSWYADNSHLGSLALSFVTVYYVLFTFFSLKTASQSTSILGLLLNTGAYYGLGLWVISDLADSPFGLFTGCVALFHIMLWLYADSKKEQSLSVAYRVLAIVFGTLVIPLELTKEWITYSWAIEAAVLIIIGAKLRLFSVRVLGYILSAITVAKIVFIDTSALAPFMSSNILGSTRLLSYLVGSLALGISAKAVLDAKLSKQESGAALLLGVASGGLLALIMALEAQQYLGLWWLGLVLVLFLKGVFGKSLGLRIGAGVLSGATILWILAQENFSNTTLGGLSLRVITYFAAISVFYIMARMSRKVLTGTDKTWSMHAYALACCWLAIILCALETDKYLGLWWAGLTLVFYVLATLYNHYSLRLSAYSLTLITVIWLVFESHLDSYLVAGTNLRVITFGAAIIIYYLIARMAYQWDNKPVVSPYTILATVLTTLLLTLEFEEKLLSVAWAVQGITLLVIGLWSNAKLLRQLGLCVFALTIVKVFFFDLQGLDVLYRIVSFMVLGVLLLVAGFLYSQHKDKIKGFI